MAIKIRYESMMNPEPQYIEKYVTTSSHQPKNYKLDRKPLQKV
jgi:hypothetical protein